MPPFSIRRVFFATSQFAKAVSDVLRIFTTLPKVCCSTSSAKKLYCEIWLLQNIWCRAMFSMNFCENEL